MKKAALSFFATLCATIMFGAIGSPLVVDTTQPLPALTRIEAWQGQRLTIIPTVRQGGTLFTNAGAQVVLQYGSNLTALAYGVMRGYLTNGTATLTSDTLGITGRCVYVASVVDAGITNVIGSGVLNVTPTTSQGAWPTLPGVTLPETDPIFVAWTNGGFAGLSAALNAVTNGGATITVDGIPYAISNGAVVAITSGSGSGISGTTATNITAGIISTGVMVVATNALDVANAAVPKADTNGWEVGSHAALATIAQMVASNAVSMTNGNAYALAQATWAATNLNETISASNNAAVVVATNLAQISLSAYSNAATSLFVGTNDVRYLAALTNVPTLAQCAVAGGFAGTENIKPKDIQSYGRVVFGVGVDTSNITATNSFGASIFGSLYQPGTMTIGGFSDGASQKGITYKGVCTMGNACYGASQEGYTFYGTNIISNQGYGSKQYFFNQYGYSKIGVSAIACWQVGHTDRGITIIDDYSDASMQRFYNDQGNMTIGSMALSACQGGYNSLGGWYIGANCHGAEQHGATESGFATNLALGAMQIFHLTAGQNALTTSGGSGSVLIGAGISSNKSALTVGDGAQSHGAGSITAGGGFWGNGAGLTNITAAQVGAVPTNRTITINGDTKALDANADFTVIGGDGISAATATNIARQVSASTVFSLTGTVAITTNRFWEIPLPVGTNCIVDMARIRLFLASTNEGSVSRRMSFSFLRTANDRCNDVEFDYTNMLFYATTTTVAEAGGVYSNVVTDASVFSVRDRICKPLIGWPDLQTVTSKTATVVGYRCTNAAPEEVGTLISKANELSIFSYIPPANTTNLVVFGGFDTPATNVLGYEILLGTARYY